MTIKLNTQQLRLVLNKHKELNGKDRLTFMVTETPYLPDNSEVNGAYKYDFKTDHEKSKIMSVRNTEINVAFWNGTYRGTYVPTESTIEVINQMLPKITGNDKDIFDRFMDESAKEIISTPTEAKKFTEEPVDVEIKKDEKKDNSDFEIQPGDIVTVKVKVTKVANGNVVIENNIPRKEVIEAEQSEENKAKTEKLKEAEEEQNKIKEVIEFAKQKKVNLSDLADALLEE